MFLNRYVSALVILPILWTTPLVSAYAQVAHRGFDGATSWDGEASSVVDSRGGTGSLDLSFGAEGVSAFTASEVGGLTFQTDGKILAAGRRSGDAAVFRLNPDGTFDETFGANGTATVDLGGTLDFFGSLAVQPDGKIIAAGSKFLNPNGDGDGAALARFNIDGSLDTSFGTEGVILEPGTPESDSPDAFWSVHLRPDGRVIAGGLRGQVFGEDEDNACYAAQYLPDGSRDSAFGTNGLVSPAPDVDVYCLGGALTPDGRYVLQADFTNFEWGAVRLLSDGALDLSFGEGGIARAATSVGIPTLGVIVGSDDSVTLGGYSTGAAALLLRFTAKGVLDTTFGTAGIAALAGLGPARSQHVSRHPDGKYLLTGDALLQSGDAVAFVARAMPDGELDSSFGTSGVGITHFGIEQGSGGGIGWTVGLDPESRILVAGNDYGAAPSLGFVARFENDVSVATEHVSTPGVLALDTPFPNPTTGHGAFTFTLAEPGPVRLVLYDVLGREVAVLAEGTRPAGQHDATLDASRLSPGLYVARLTAGSEVATRRLTVIR